jgi:hypothetical protein
MFGDEAKEMMLKELREREERILRLEKRLENAMVGGTEERVLREKKLRGESLGERGAEEKKSGKELVKGSSKATVRKENLWTEQEKSLSGKTLTEESLRREQGQNEEDTDRISFAVDREEKDEVEIELNKVDMEVKATPTEKKLLEVWKRYGSKWKKLQRMEEDRRFSST